MKLKNILLVVSDIERSKAFYKEIFGLSVIRDFGENVILTEGLVLQEQKVWEQAIGKEVQIENHACELYFEENDLDAFVMRLKDSSWKIQFLNSNIEINSETEKEQLTDSGRERHFVRFYDPDGHVIEVGC